MKKVFVFLCLLGVAVSKPGFRFGTRYGNAKALNYIPASIVSSTPTPYKFSNLFGNTFTPTPAPTFIRATPSPFFIRATSSPNYIRATSKPQLLQYVAPNIYFSPNRQQQQPPRISDTLFAAPLEQGFISSTASPPLLGIGGASFGTTVSPPINVLPVDNVNANPIPVEVSNIGDGGINTVENNVFEVPVDEAEITKHFYIHSAPEEPEEVVHKHFTIGKPQKAYRVVFIKAPASNAQASISASFAPKEEKTVIYVLSKKPNHVEIKDVVTPPPTEPSKPEVIFVKYKTNEEAIHAQQSIQAQYDQLGGSSQVSNEGVAPITSVVGVLDQSDQNNQNEVLADPIVAVTPTPASASGIYPLNQNYKVLAARSVE